MPVKTLCKTGRYIGSPGKPCVRKWSGIDATEPEKEISDIGDTSELSSEGLYLSVERFGGSVCGTVVKEVEDVLIVVVNRLLYGAERVNPRLLDLVEPSCQFCVGHALDFCLGVDQPQFVRQRICLGDVGVYVEQEPRPGLLRLRPFLRGLEEDISTAKEELLEGVSVGEELWPVLLPGEFRLPYLLVLQVHGIPPEPDPQFLDRVECQFLHVETVYYLHRVRER